MGLTGAPEAARLHNHSVRPGTERELFCYSVRPGKKHCDPKAF